jgi:FAD/FMN-containing dehydrogenase
MGGMSPPMARLQRALRGPVLIPDHPAWARRTSAVLADRSTSGGGYLNYGAPDEPIERVRAAYGHAKFERLRQVKRRYDPHNLFRFNHNIPPAEE